MKQLLGAESKTHLEKPQDLTLARLWGHSVTSANGDVWRRHRRVVSPAFNNKTYSDVWKTVRSVYREMIDTEGWNEWNEIVFDEVNSLILKFTFIIICRCGFAYPSSWSPTYSSTDKFPEALRLVSETLIPRLVIPNWAYKLPIGRLRRMNNAWQTVTSAIMDLIEKRKSDSLEFNYNALPSDILNCLVTSWIDGDKNGLEERDVANMFSLMFAGHETTSSGIVTTLGYLALYPAVQEKAYEEISKVFAENDPSEIMDQSKLPFTLFCFWEAQRLCPSATLIPRQLTEDTIINISRPKRERMVLKKGSFAMFDLIGILRNPDTFHDPETFRPERWENVSEHDVGAFGFGPRACLGVYLAIVCRKVAQTEALAFLSTLLSDWKVGPNLLPDESLSQYEERVMGDAALIGTAFGLRRVPLKLSKRRI
ncbi:cytochrome P450 [Sanghuangporus baumii]|uniref:Cytochrome P450 n=1 Tax=Sanghuangporus baumii TaxID=108892 RepID=A0A9Q5HSE6_SANBA|nr:cytochrome P450 [Sanghuangporus baumii]